MNYHTFMLTRHFLTNEWTFLLNYFLKLFGMFLNSFQDFSLPEFLNKYFLSKRGEFLFRLSTSLPTKIVQKKSHFRHTHARTHTPTRTTMHARTHTHRVYWRSIWIFAPHSFDPGSEDVVSCPSNRPHTSEATSTSTSASAATSSSASTSDGSGSSAACVVVADEVCGPIAVGGWSKADDTVFIREVSHACAMWERIQMHQQPQQPPQQRQHALVKPEVEAEGGQESDKTTNQKGQDLKWVLDGKKTSLDSKQKLES